MCLKNEIAVVAPGIRKWRFVGRLSAIESQPGLLAGEMAAYIGPLGLAMFLAMNRIWHLSGYSGVLNIAVNNFYI